MIRRGIISVLITLLVSSFVTTKPLYAADYPPVEDMYPENIHVTPLGGSARVTWDPVTEVGYVDMSGGYGGAAVAARYFVTSSYDPTTNTGYRTCLAIVPENSCVVTGLTNGVAYTFQVRTDTRVVAHNNPIHIGEVRRWSNYSPPSAPVLPCCDAPGVVNSPTAIAQGDAIEVTWEPPNSWGGSQELTYDVSSETGVTFCTTRATTCMVRDLPYGRPQGFLITASAAGTPGASVATPQVTIPLQAPGPTSAPSVTYGRNGNAEIRWKPPLRDGGSPILGYTVVALPGGHSCTTTGSTRCTIVGLSTGKNFTFTVRSQNKFGASDASPPAVAGRLITPASAPTNVLAAEAANSVQLSWKKPASAGGGRILKFIVEESNRVVCKTSRTSCRVSGLKPGTSYKFNIYALNSSGQGKPAVIAAKTLVPFVKPPAPPVVPGPAPTPPKPELSIG